MTIINTGPISAKENDKRAFLNISYNTKENLSVNNKQELPQDVSLRFGIDLSSAKIKSKIFLNKTHKLNFDHSFSEYNGRTISYGIGIIDRHWGFSENESLIFSKNSRPLKSIYFKIRNNFKLPYFINKFSWDFEMFNGVTEGSISNSSSMLLGARAVINLSDNLKFELAQTSQWGGRGYNKDIRAFSDALIGDSNEGKNKDINKLAGFGISYSFAQKIPLRIYGQAIGEDESGNLPNCFMYLAGIELHTLDNLYPSKIGVEYIDTRINQTQGGNCGKNTAYNNNIYNYTNYNRVMGSSIDSEGSLISFYGKSNITNALNIEYSIKKIVINDASYSNHRLSTRRETGVSTDFKMFWDFKNSQITTGIHYQELNLDKIKLKDGLGLSISSSIYF